MGDHSFKHDFFPIWIQNLTTALKRILFSSVVMVLAFGARGHWFKSCLDLIFLPCINLFICFFVTDLVRKMIFFLELTSHNLQDLFFQHLLVTSLSTKHQKFKTGQNWKHVRRKCWLPASSPLFPHNNFYSYHRQIPLCELHLI